jgi:hypothetical protein
VTPSGKVATITGWDEGGANVALYSSTGAKLGIPVESGTGSWGRNSGSAVFVDDAYLYQSMKQDGGYDADGIKYPVDPKTIWKAIAATTTMAAPLRSRRERLRWQHARSK